MENQVKPRYDKAGSEFGLIHRKLPADCCMFDIDKMTAKAVVSLEMTRQDVGFLEYKTDLKTAEIKWKALFEIKYKDSEHVRDAMMFKIGTATFAQLKLCEKIGARYFIVIATYGKQPFTFYEIMQDGSYIDAGVLNYDDKELDGRDKIRHFWEKNLKL